MPTLDLVMIVRDEARCLARCLRSVRPWVDAMVVLDTGSRDDTVQIARDEGAQVFHFDWCEDFAAARNAALAHSQADWRLVLDADEYLVEGAEGLRALLSASAGASPWVGVVAVESDCETSGLGAPAGVSVNRISRLLPRGATYAGRIHEQVQSPGPRIPLPLRIGHDGYRREFRQHKHERNQRLLTSALHASPASPYLLYQLGKEAESVGLHAAASDWYAQAGQALAGDVPWALDLTVRRLHCLSMAGQHEAAVRLAGENAEHWADAVDFHFVVGTLMLNWACAQPQLASECLPMAQGSWQRCLALGEQDGHDGAVKGRGSHLAAWNLMALHEGLGEAARAAEYRELALSLRRTPQTTVSAARGPSSDREPRSINAREPALGNRALRAH